MKNIIVFTDAIFEETKRFMLSDPSNEQFGFLFAGVNKTDSSLKLLVRGFLPARENDLVYRTGAGVRPTPEFQMSAYSLCKKEGFHLIDVHSHPFSVKGVTFSSIDDRSELGTAQGEGTFGFTARWIPGIYHASMVFGQESVDARIYNALENNTHQFDEIKIISRHSKQIISTSSSKNHGYSSLGFWRRKKNTKDDEKYSSQYSRQILAFGKVGQEELAKTTVGVVGAGGLGSVVVEILARLGVGKIICADNDIIEAPNLSRIIGSTPEDIKLKREKVEVLKRHVLSFNPKVEFEAIPDSILNPETLMKFREVDYIISGTDTISSRMILNSFSMQYLIPYIDLGFGIEVDDTKKVITSAGGKVRVIIPGEWCLQCTGEINQRQIQLELMSDFEKKREITLGYISGVDIPDPSVIFLDTTVVSLGICEFLNLLVSFKVPAQYIFYNVLETKILSLNVKKLENCIICSNDGVFGKGDLIPIIDIRDKGPLRNIPSISEK